MRSSSNSNIRKNRKKIVLPTSNEAVAPAGRHPVLYDPAGAELAGGAGVGDEPGLRVSVVAGGVVGAPGQEVPVVGGPVSGRTHARSACF